MGFRTRPLGTSCESGGNATGAGENRRWSVRGWSGWERYCPRLRRGVMAWECKTQPLGTGAREGATGRNLGRAG